MTIELIQTGLTQGLILAFLTYGIMIPFRFLNFPDLSAEGSYPLAGSICACLISLGYPPVLAVLISMVGAGMMVVGTGQVALRLKVNSLLAGIIISTICYSLNLRIMGKPNIALFNYPLLPLGSLELMAILTLTVLPFVLFLLTDVGLRFRAVGLNPGFAVKQGISVGGYTSFGLFCAGAMFGLAGSLIVQIQQFMDIGMGVGIVIHGLAALMIGEAIIGNNTMTRQLIAPLVGALTYQQIQGFALSAGLAPSDLKLFTGVVVLLVIAVQRMKEKTL